MIESVVLSEGQNVNPETLGISLGNAKQLVIGSADAIDVILHIAANSLDLGNALVEFAQVPSVTGVLTLALRSPSPVVSDAPTEDCEAA